MIKGLLMSTLVITGSLNVQRRGKRLALLFVHRHLPGYFSRSTWLLTIVPFRYGLDPSV